MTAVGSRQTIGGAGLAACVLLGLASCSRPSPRVSPPSGDLYRSFERAEWRAWKSGDRERDREFLAESLWSPDPLCRLLAVRSLVRIRPRAAARLVEARWHHEPIDVHREEMIWALGRLGDASSLSFVREVARQGGPGLRGACAEAFAALGDVAVDDLLELLDDRDREVRLEAMLSLVRHPEIEASGGIERALRRQEDERDERLRWAAVQAMARRPDLAARFRERFAGWVVDRNPLVSIHAMEALPGLPGDAGLDEVARLAVDPGHWRISRRVARRALERWLHRGDLPGASRRLARDALDRPLPAPAAEPLLAAHDPTGLPAPGERDGRRRRLLVEVDRKGQLVIELSHREAPGHVRALVDLVLSGRFRDVRPRVEGLAGLEFRPAGDAGDSGDFAPGALLPPEPHRAPIRRGTVTAGLTEASAPGRFLIALRPLPELESRVTVLGRVVLGARLLERLTPDDTLTFHAF